MGGRGSSSGNTGGIKKGNEYSNPKYSFKVTGFIKDKNNKNIGVYATITSSNVTSGKNSRRYKPGSSLMIAYDSPSFKEAKRKK